MSDREKIDYLIADFDRYLRDGKTPMEALNLTMDDYQYVFDIFPSSGLIEKKLSIKNSPLKFGNITLKCKGSK
jgi:hypothetical protein